MRKPGWEILEWRLPVWRALSEFFLDTKLDDADLKRIAAVLAASPYSDGELYEIVNYEVYPPCHWNLLCVVGEWAAFGDDWILERVAPRYGQRPWLKIGPLHQWMYRDSWYRVCEHLHALRNT